MAKQHKSTAEDNLYIETIVTAFYKKAVADFLIGYQFRKIATLKGADPLSPPIEAFKEHLPRISTFWKMQLLHHKKPASTLPFDLINIHEKLSIRKGELGRWLMLFKATLDEYEDCDLKKLWTQKIDQFEIIFNKQFF